MRATPAPMHSNDLGAAPARTAMPAPSRASGTVSSTSPIGAGPRWRPSAARTRPPSWPDGRTGGPAWPRSAGLPAPGRSVRSRAPDGHPRLHAHPRLPQEPGGHRGDARDARRGRLPPGPGSRPGRGRGGEHLRLHRERQGRVHRRHRGAGRAEADRRVQEAGRDRLPGAAPRGGAGARAPRGGPLPRDRRLRRRGHHRLRRPGEAPGGPRPRLRPLRQHPAHQLAPLPHRLRQDRRGLRQRLRLLHHPAAARPAALPADRRPGGRGGGAGRPGDGGALAGGPGPHRLRPRPPGQGAAPPPAARAMPGRRDPLDPAPLRLPARRPRGAAPGDRAKSPRS